MAGALPSKLYKYVPAERIDILRNACVRFTPPAVFNDPFELRPALLQIAMASDYERLGDVELEHQLAERFAADHRHSESLRSEIGVLSLTERPDNLLMWSHYADHHRGFLLEFDPAHPFFHQRQTDDDEFHHLRKVRYAAGRPSTLIDSFVNAETLLTKSPQWRYEREWRMLVHFPRFAHCLIRKGARKLHLVSIPHGCITGVICGARMSEAGKAKLEQIAADSCYSHLKFRYAELDTGSYKVVFPKARYYFDRANTLIHRAAHLRLAQSQNRSAKDRPDENPRKLFQSAIADLNRALRFSPSSVPYLFYRASAYRLLGRLEEAISDCSRALEISPKSKVQYRELHRMRAQLYIRLGRLDEAERDLNRIPDDEEAIYLLEGVRFLRTHQAEPVR